VTTAGDERMLVGLISDTHSLMRAEALAALHGVELILHAGDVGAHSVLRELSVIAPVHAVAGNTDGPELDLARLVTLTLDGLSVVLTHGHELGSPTPDNLSHRYSADVIVYGHTHRPLIETRGRTLIVNPGAAGPRRFNLKPSVGLLRITNRRPSAEIIEI
jgi:putative phosphoesterase